MGKCLCYIQNFLFVLGGFGFGFGSEASLLTFSPLKGRKKRLMNKNNLKAEAFRAKGLSVQQNNNNNNNNFKKALTL